MRSRQHLQQQQQQPRRWPLLQIMMLATLVVYGTLVITVLDGIHIPLLEDLLGINAKWRRQYQPMGAVTALRTSSGTKRQVGGRTSHTVVHTSVLTALGIPQRRIHGLPRRGETLLFMLSSFDRGERLANWKGTDKMSIILKVVDAARELCEIGYDVTFYMISAWPASASKDEIESHLLCSRVGRVIPTHYWDHFTESVGGKLAQKHRILLERELFKFDFFISIEDDMLLRSDMVEAYRRHTALISEAGGARSRRFLPGYIRYETVNGSRLAWEGTLDGVHVEKVAGQWYAKIQGFGNQAMWMASREQIVDIFNASCNEPFLKPFGPGWVEFWSGGVQLYEQCGYRKVIPLEEFEKFTLFHMTNNKVGFRGNPNPVSVDSLIERCDKLRADCIQQGVSDSYMLKPTL